MLSSFVHLLRTGQVTERTEDTKGEGIHCMKELTTISLSSFKLETSSRNP